MAPNSFQTNVSSDLVSSPSCDLDKSSSPLEFPERPHALRNFLLGLQHDWNITLFHYRNHGAGMVVLESVEYSLILFIQLDIGKVLAGIQVPPSEYAKFDGFLKKLNYTYVEETENPVYKRFLHGGS